MTALNAILGSMTKFSSSSFKVTELIDIVDLFGYELKIVPKNSIDGINDSVE